LYAGVEIVSAASPTAAQAATNVATAGQTYVCPRTGCSAPTCHAVTGEAPGATAATGGTTDGAVPDTSGTVQTCPATGCSASTCHGATGSPPPSAGSGTDSGTTYGDSGSSSDGQSGSVQTCPRTGCTASTCHGATGSPPPGRGRHGGSSDGIFQQ
jgi:hypothetical protein